MARTKPQAVKAAASEAPDAMEDAPSSSPPLLEAEMPDKPTTLRWGHVEAREFMRYPGGGSGIPEDEPEPTWPTGMCDAVPVRNPFTGAIVGYHQLPPVVHDHSKVAPRGCLRGTRERHAQAAAAGRPPTPLPSEASATLSPEELASLSHAAQARTAEHVYRGEDLVQHPRADVASDLPHSHAGHHSSREGSGGAGAAAAPAAGVGAPAAFATASVAAAADPSSFPFAAGMIAVAQVPPSPTSASSSSSSSSAAASASVSGRWVSEHLSLRLATSLEQLSASRARLLPRSRSLPGTFLVGSIEEVMAWRVDYHAWRAAVEEERAVLERTAAFEEAGVLARRKGGNKGRASAAAALKAFMARQRRQLDEDPGSFFVTSFRPIPPLERRALFLRDSVLEVTRWVADGAAAKPLSPTSLSASSVRAALLDVLNRENTRLMVEARGILASRRSNKVGCTCTPMGPADFVSLSQTRLAALARACKLPVHGNRSALILRLLAFSRTRSGCMVPVPLDPQVYRIDEDEEEAEEEKAAAAIAAKAAGRAGHGSSAGAGGGAGSAAAAAGSSGDAARADEKLTAAMLAYTARGCSGEEAPIPGQCLFEDEAELGPGQCACLHPRPAPVAAASTAPAASSSAAAAAAAVAGPQFHTVWQGSFYGTLAPLEQGEGAKGGGEGSAAAAEEAPCMAAAATASAGLPIPQAGQDFWPRRPRFKPHVPRQPLSDEQRLNLTNLLASDPRSRTYLNLHPTDVHKLCSVGRHAYAAEPLDHGHVAALRLHAAMEADHAEFFKEAAAVAAAAASAEAGTRSSTPALLAPGDKPAASGGPGFRAGAGAKRAAGSSGGRPGSANGGVGAPVATAGLDPTSAGLLKRLMAVCPCAESGRGCHWGTCACCQECCTRRDVGDPTSSLIDFEADTYRLCIRVLADHARSNSEYFINPLAVEKMWLNMRQLQEEGEEDSELDDEEEEEEDEEDEAEEEEVADLAALVQGDDDSEDEEGDGVALVEMEVSAVGSSSSEEDEDGDEDDEDEDEDDDDDDLMAGADILFDDDVPLAMRAALLATLQGSSGGSSGGGKKRSRAVMEAAIIDTVGSGSEDGSDDEGNSADEQDDEGGGARGRRQPARKRRRRGPIAAPAPAEDDEEDEEEEEEDGEEDEDQEAELMQARAVFARLQPQGGLARSRAGDDTPGPGQDGDLPSDAASTVSDPDDEEEEDEE